MCKSDYAKQLRATADQERSTMENATGGSTRASTSSVEALPVRRSRQRDIRDMTDQVAHNRLDYLWAAAVAENDLAFNVSKSKSIQAFVDAVIMYVKPYTLPTPYKVSGPLLDKLKADSEDLLRPVKESWKTSGCSLSVNGWTDIKSRGFVCVIAQNDTAPVIVDIVDSKTVKKSGDYLATLIQGAITTVGPKHVVQVVMDNASNNKNAASKLSADYPHIFFTNCAAHCLDLMLHDIGKIRETAHFIKRTGLLLPKDRSTFLTSIKAIIARRLGSDDARWAATTLVEAGRMTEAEWWFLFGGEVQALQDLAVTSLSQPVTSSEVERYWSPLARVQRRDRNRLTAKKMTDVTFVAFTRRARDAFDRKAALRSKLYQDLGNGTLREGAAIIPAEVEVEEGDAEEEAPVEEECTIDWSEFGSIGKKRKGKAGRGDEHGACQPFSDYWPIPRFTLEGERHLLQE
ncbi:unnamed protein product [Closterium sp. NIES-65]|nr:unnamed protein product [Closterium sp. NIES-65]